MVLAFDRPSHRGMQPEDRTYPAARTHGTRKQIEEMAKDKHRITIAALTSLRLKK